MHEKKIKPGMPLKKLTLTRETIKSLAGQNLTKVVGGGRDSHPFYGCGGY